MSNRDYYEILGVPRNASEEEIKVAFLKLARQYHPAVNSEPSADQKFREVNEAYGVLSDIENRARYDRFGHEGLGNFGDFSDYTADFGDLFEDILGGFGFSTRMNARKMPSRGRDFQMQVTLKFQEAVFGVEKEINYRHEEFCARCAGSGTEPGTLPTKCETCKGKGEVRQVRQTFLGQMVQTATCPICKGRGEIILSPCQRCHGNGLERKWIKKKVQIPAGVDSRTQIRLAGEGGLGSFGGPNGSLFLVLDVQPHELFERRNNDIVLHLDITDEQAEQGAVVQVPTLDGTEQLIIPAGTRSGKTLILKRKGIPYLRGLKRGDQLMIINVGIPPQLRREQHKHFNEPAYETLAGDQTTNAPPPKSKKKRKGK